MSTNTILYFTMSPCPYCSTTAQQTYHSGLCPKVKAIEYYPNGTVKRVEFNTVPVQNGPRMNFVGDNLGDEDHYDG